MFLYVLFFDVNFKNQHFSFFDLVINKHKKHGGGNIPNNQISNKKEKLKKFLFTENIS